MVASSFSLSLDEMIILFFDTHQKGANTDAGRKKKGLVADSVEGQAELILQHIVNRKETEDSVQRSVIHCVKTALAASSSSSSDDFAIDRVLGLAAALCFKLDRACFSALWTLAVQASKSRLDPLRCKGCFLIGTCLKCIANSQDHDFVAEYCRLAEKTLTPRLTDKSHLVRYAAINAGRYNFFNEQCWPVDLEECLIISMTHDSSFSNRMAAVNCVPITEETIPFIIERTRDVKPKVRESALLALKIKVDFDVLNEKQRIEILLSGLTERCPTTYEAAVKLLCCSWMKRFKFDPLDLVRNLNPIENDPVCEKAIRAIIHVADGTSKSILTELSPAEREAFKDQVSAACRDITSQSIDPAMALFLRVQFGTIVDSKTLTSAQKSERIFQILPDLATLCDIIQDQLHRYVRGRLDNLAEDKEVEKLELHSCFICSQLLLLAQKTDIQEEAGLRRLASLIHNMLCSSDTPEDLIESSVQTLSFIQSSEVDFVRCVSEAMLEVGCVTDCTNVEESASRQIRSLAILSIALENLSITTKQKSTLQGFSDTILPCVNSENVIVRQAAVSCLGKYALFADREVLSPLLLEITQNERETIEVRAQALLGLCDLTVLADIVYDDSADLCVILLGFLRHSEVALVIVAAEVCAKLLLSGRLHSCDILSHLVITFFSICGSVEDEHDGSSEVGCPRRLGQMLSLFFSAYCICHEKNRMLLLQSIKPLVKKTTIISHNATGKQKKELAALASTLTKMVDFVCSTVNTASSHGAREVGDELQEGKNDDMSITAPDNYSANGMTELHVAVSVSEALLEIYEDISVPNLRIVCKMLASLTGKVDFEFAKKDCSLWKQACALKHSWEDLELLVSDHYAYASLDKLRDSLEQVHADVNSRICSKISDDDEDKLED